MAGRAPKARGAKVAGRTNKAKATTTRASAGDKDVGVGTKTTRGAKSKTTRGRKKD